MTSNIPRMIHHGLVSISTTRIPKTIITSSSSSSLVSPTNVITHTTIVPTRSYRGDSGDMKYRKQISPNPTQDQIIQREEELLKVAVPKYDMIHERHIRMPKLEEIPQASLPLEFREGIIPRKNWSWK
jgi:hypothetical protein